MYKKLLLLTILLCGIVWLLSGVWIQLKPRLAHHLLLRAWLTSQTTAKVVKPWPWADSWPVGRLVQQRLGVDLIVLEGDSGEVLAFGPGHLSQSANPGAGGHCVLAGHRDTTFSFLQYLRVGDILLLEGEVGKRVYRVVGTEVVAANTLYLEREGGDFLSLITCYPFDSIVPGTALRYLVTAHSVKES